MRFLRRLAAKILAWNQTMATLSFEIFPEKSLSVQERSKNKIKYATLLYLLL